MPHNNYFSPRICLLISFVSVLSSCSPENRPPLPAGYQRCTIKKPPQNFVELRKDKDGDPDTPEPGLQTIEREKQLFEGYEIVIKDKNKIPRSEKFKERFVFVEEDNDDKVKGWINKNNLNCS
jgi:hypothetical protein